MKISDQLLRRIESDLGLNLAFRKGADIPVSNCWHFCTDGNSVDTMFYDEQDFIDGMNRIYPVSRSSGVVILAFVLMDTHIHFILYGAYDDCNAFIHEYVRRTSMHLAHRHNFARKLRNLSISCQNIGTDSYLRTAICYVLRNPVAAGLKFRQCCFGRFRVALDGECFRGDHPKAVSESQLFDGGCFELHAAAAGPIGLSKNQNDLMACLKQSLECGGSKRRCSCKSDAHNVFVLGKPR